ncbi:MAG: lamin tail domain-containing protein [Bacteroidia bacterium]
MQNKLTLLFLIGMLGLSYTASAQCNDLFISEYIEGSSNNKAVEIYNASSAAMDLTDIQMHRYNNGATTNPDTLDFMGMLMPYDVYVAGNSSADPAITMVSDTLHSITFYNGDDALVLLNVATGDTLDMIGRVGEDPGSWWPINPDTSGTTQNFTLRRKIAINDGTTDWAASSASQWDVFMIDDFGDIGMHMGDCASAAAGCNDLFFSEYIEGSSNNKAIEIYNADNMAIDLTPYQVHRYNNGGTTNPDTLDLEGMLMPYDVYVAGNSSADPAITAVSDTLHSITFYNGDDALVLLNVATGDTVDVIGRVGEDPGSWWPINPDTSGTTQNFTLRRKASVNQGTTDWTASSASEWEVFMIDDFGDIGAHVSNCVMPAGCDNLLISEYIEGSSNNKAIEVYNANAMPIDLTPYQIHRYNNGGTTNPDTLDLQGMLMPYDVYVAGNSSADPLITAASDTLHSITFYNGDDALVLLNVATGDTLDIIGRVGEDPGSWWPINPDTSGTTQNFTLRRKATVSQGNTDWTASSAGEWEVFMIDDFGDIGMHTSNCSMTMGCDDLLFSEYIEGSSNNKAIEIYNANDMAIDLTDYHVHRYNNGGTTNPDTLDLQGMLMPYDVYVAGNSSAIAGITSVSDTLHTITFYNGDDALILLNVVTGDTLDIIGRLGEDPGSWWPINPDTSGTTQNFTLRRKSTITSGTTDWTASSMNQWDVFMVDDVSDLGSHSSDCAPIPVFAEVDFVMTAMTVNEGDGTVSFDVEITNSGADTVAVAVMLDASSTATNGTDFAWNDTTINFPANATMPVSLSLSLTDDTDIEANETIVLMLANATNGAMIGDTTLTIEIEDNDYAIYPIGVINNDSDGDGLTDSLGVRCQIQGIVHGIDLQGGGAVQFTLIDSTGGISLFSGNDFGYTVLEGDDVVVQGTIEHFNGLGQISPDTLYFVSAANALVIPMPVTVLDEVSESELVVLECVTLVDTLDWPTSTGGSVNVDVTNGDSTFTIRIDSDTDLNGSPAPTSYFNLVGIGGQFDSSDPRTSGYQLLPRYIADVIESGAPEAGFAMAAMSVNEEDSTYAIEIAITNSNPDSTEVSVALDATNTTATLGTDFNWSDSTLVFQDCGDGSATLGLSIVDDNDVEGDEFVSLVITSVTNSGSVSIDTLTVTITETDRIEDLLPKNAIQLFPNPASTQLSLRSDYRLETVRITNLMGQELMRQDLNQPQADLNIAHLPTGVYLIRVQTNEGSWTSRWIKQ